MATIYDPNKARDRVNLAYEIETLKGILANGDAPGYIELGNSTFRWNYASHSDPEIVEAGRKILQQRLDVLLKQQDDYRLANQD